MAYEFNGLLVRAYASVKVDATLIEVTKQRWPNSTARIFRTPFQGIGVSIPELDLDYVPAESVEKEICMLNKSYSETSFVFVHVECWGGNCQYEGFVCRDGIVIARETGKGALRRLIAHLDEDLGESEYFVPFERGFFK